MKGFFLIKVTYVKMAPSKYPFVLIKMVLPPRLERGAKD